MKRLSWRPLENTGRKVWVSPTVDRLYQPQLRNDTAVPEFLEQFLWNRLDRPVRHPRRLLFGYRPEISTFIENHNPPFTAINWVNLAPTSLSSAQKITQREIAKRAIYGNERTTDTRLRPVYTTGLLAARQMASHVGGTEIGQMLPVYGFDSLLGIIAARAAYCWTVDAGAHNARKQANDERLIQQFLSIFQFNES